MNTVDTWNEAIEKSIESLRGRAKLDQVYARLPRFIELSEDDRREAEWGGRLMYQHRVRYACSQLVKDGRLVRVGRGDYALPGWPTRPTRLSG